MADPTGSHRRARPAARARASGSPIDDFGTGYSSLAYLKRLPVDEVKIDKSFVPAMASDHEDRAIVLATVDLGHNLGLRVVAEGVEDEGTWRRLAALGCDLAQGLLLRPPATRRDAHPADPRRGPAPVGVDDHARLMGTNYCLACPAQTPSGQGILDGGEGALGGAHRGQAGDAPAR